MAPTPILSDAINRFKIWSKKTLASCEWAKESAHKRKYDAVLEMLPNTNSIVSIILKDKFNNLIFAKLLK